MKTPVGPLRAVFSALFLSFILVSAAFAQFRAGIQGATPDSAGALVPGAKVPLSSVETNVAHTTETGDSGVYTFVGLAPGKYTLTIEKAGFNKKVLSDVELGAEQVQTINVTMDIGQITQTVTVDAAVVPAIDTESAEIAGAITNKEIHDLPSLGRDAYQLTRLAPGVFGDGQGLPGFNIGQSGSIYGVENGVQVSANGGRQNSNAFQIDGVSVNSTVWGGAPVITPNEESIRKSRLSPITTAPKTAGTAARKSRWFRKTEPTICTAAPSSNFTARALMPITVGMVLAPPVRLYAITSASINSVEASADPSSATGCSPSFLMKRSATNLPASLRAGTRLRNSCRMPDPRPATLAECCHFLAKHRSTQL